MTWCSRDNLDEAAYTPAPSSTLRPGRYVNEMGAATPGVFGMTPTAAGYTPFRRPSVMDREEALAGGRASTISSSPPDR